MVADRELRLAGYEVYRFGGHEIADRSRAASLLERFFAGLFRPGVRPCHLAPLFPALLALCGLAEGDVTVGRTQSLIQRNGHWR